MTKDVLVTVKGLQSIEAGEPEEVEMISRGDYYYKNGHHYIFFDVSSRRLYGKYAKQYKSIRQQCRG